MEERLTWKEIKKKYPRKWVGLLDVEWNGGSIKSAILIQVDEKSGPIFKNPRSSELVICYTTPNEVFF